MTTPDPQLHDSRIGVMVQQLSRMENKLDRLNAQITGNSEPETGLLWRVRKLEESEGKRSKVLWATITAVASGAGLWLWNLMVQTRGNG